MKLTKLLSILPSYKISNQEHYEKINELMIHSIEIDHRNIKQGDLFVCLKGFTLDGHDFIGQATKNGACAIVAERDVEASIPTIIVTDTTRVLAMIATIFFDFPSHRLPLIGITGTNGKTTTTYLLEAIFNEYKLKTGIIGTIQMKIGENSYAINNTTPNALLLQKTFREMLTENVDFVMMEVSSHALDLGRVFGCDFNIVAFTNLSQDHLDYHKDMNDYLRVKSLLFAQLGNSYHVGDHKFAILNADDPSIDLLRKSTAQHVLTYGCKNKADIKATHIKLSLHHTKFLMVTPIGEISINSRLTGMFNIYNMLAAGSIALAANVPLHVIKKALETIPGINGRFERVDAGQDYAVIVDYAHTPDSLENVLQTISEFAKQKVFVVVGCGGDRDRTKRPLMGDVAVKYADYTMFTSDNPRTEKPHMILRDMTKGLTAFNYQVIEDREEAIVKAIQLAKKDDVILIAGKGHETYQEIDGVKYEFDDREIALKAIKKRS